MPGLLLIRTQVGRLGAVDKGVVVLLVMISSTQQSPLAGELHSMIGNVVTGDFAHVPTQRHVHVTDVRNRMSTAYMQSAVNQTVSTKSRGWSWEARHEKREKQRVTVGSTRKGCDELRVLFSWSSGTKVRLGFAFALYCVVVRHWAKRGLIAGSMSLNVCGVRQSGITQKSWPLCGIFESGRGVVRVEAKRRCLDVCHRWANENSVTEAQGSRGAGIQIE